jgi:hypothetical protein
MNFGTCAAVLSQRWLWQPWNGSHNNMQNI